MDEKIQVKTQNKYNIKVIRDGVIREEYNFSNTLCKGILVDSSTTTWASVHIGKGTGTPSWNDTDVFSSLWNIEPVITYENTSSYSKAIILATVPADSSHVGDITEVAMYYAAGKGTITHALVSDAEGNPITINKTDLDILIITIELIFTATVDGQMSGKVVGDNIHTAAREYLMFNSKPNLSFYLSENGMQKLTSVSSVKNRTVDNALKQLKYEFNTLRLNTGDVNTHYIKTASICSDKGWDIKDIFTPYTMTGATIGTGDGATTVFACPLSYFKEGTEKIYKNGVELTRGVDYTLDNINNTGAALFCNNDLYTEITGGENDENLPTEYNSAESSYQFLGTHRVKSNYALKPPAEGYVLTKDKPIFVDYKTPKRCNYIKLSNGIGSVGKVTLSYSTDGAAYTPVFENEDFTSKGLEKTFSEITARYWRLSTSSDTRLSQSIASSVNELADMSYLAHKTDGITFTQAPANGDVLTMDATIDYPFKNDKHVIDINWTCTITLV